MIKKTSVLAAIVCAAGLVGVVAQVSAASATHSIKQSGAMSIVKTDEPSLQAAPVKGDYELWAGTLSGIPGGKGAVVFNQVFNGGFGPSGVPITDTATFFEPDGSYSGAGSGVCTPRGCTATMTIKTGAGLYKGANGKLTFTQGTYNNGSEELIKVTGSIKY